MLNQKAYRKTIKHGSISPWTGIPELVILLFIAFGVCMKSPLNPFISRCPGTDSSVFLTIARGMTEGKAPYVDFFDHKGPLLYLIDYFGLLLFGTRGVWLIEFLFMFVSVFFAYKTALFFSKTSISLLSTGFAFLILLFFFHNGNLTEEYVLPFLFISLYIFAAFFFKSAALSRIKLFVLGACFGASLMLRPNMFGLWAAFCVVIFILAIIQKKYSAALRYVVCFLLGLISFIFPFIIYLRINNALSDFLYQYISFNRNYAAYSVNITTLIKNIFSTINSIYSWLLPLVAAVWLIKKRNNKEYAFYIAFFFAVLISILFISFSNENYDHYSMVLIPLFIPVLTFCINALFEYFSPSNNFFIKHFVPFLIICVIFNYYITRIAYEIYTDIRSTEKDKIAKICGIIDANTNKQDTITVFGNNCVLYFYSDRDSASKYIYQFPIADISRKVFLEYQNDIITGSPTLIIIPTQDGRLSSIMNSDNTNLKTLYVFLSELAAEKYSEIYQDDGYIIYKKKV
jgi:hypothetical protein